MTKIIPILAWLGCLFFTSTSHGQSSPNEERHHVPVIILDGTSSLFLGSSLYCSRMTVSSGCSWLGAAGLATYAFGPALVHLRHGESRNALMSVGFRSLVPSLTLFLVINRARAPSDSGISKTEYGLIATAYMLPMLLDWAFLSKHNQETVAAVRMLSFTLPF